MVIELNLINAPFLQIAFDTPTLELVQTLFTKIKSHPKLILEVGTPLLKNEGLKNIVPFFRDNFPSNYILVDLKTLDVGKLEVELAKNCGANGCVVSGLAPLETIIEFGKACKNLGLDMWVDSLGTTRETFLKKLKQFSGLIEVVIIHRGIDEELGLSKRESQVIWRDIPAIKEIARSKVAVAGGITLNTINEALENKADIIIVGRYIYSAEMPQRIIDAMIKRID